MKRMISTLLVAAVVALSAVSVASAREWYLPIPQTITQAKAQMHQVVAKKQTKTNYSAYYRGPH